GAVGVVAVDLPIAVVVDGVLAVLEDPLADRLVEAGRIRAVGLAIAVVVDAVAADLHPGLGRRPRRTSQEQGKRGADEEGARKHDSAPSYSNPGPVSPAGGLQLPASQTRASAIAAGSAWTKRIAREAV